MRKLRMKKYSYIYLILLVLGFNFILGCGGESATHDPIERATNFFNELINIVTENKQNPQTANKVIDQFILEHETEFATIKNDILKLTEEYLEKFSEKMQEFTDTFSAFLRLCTEAGIESGF